MPATPPAITNATAALEGTTLSVEYGSLCIRNERGWLLYQRRVSTIPTESAAQGLLFDEILATVAANALTAPDTGEPEIESAMPATLSDSEKVEAFRSALWAYHRALDAREHGDVAAGHFVDAARGILGMPWEQGATLKSEQPPVPAVKTACVVGFLFSPDYKKVVLIRKNRPAFCAGKLNGPGGHVEPGESPQDAMPREFHEETEKWVRNWRPVVSMEFPHLIVHFFATVGSGDVGSPTEEPVAWYDVATLVREDLCLGLDVQIIQSIMELKKNR
jgi:8-oxo-dGTP pyrophosphatase MutT (NUDIX family)